MAKKKADALAAAVEPAAIYSVQLAKLVKVGRLTLLPGRRNRLRGDALVELLTADAAAVVSHEKA